MTTAIYTDDLGRTVTLPSTVTSYAPSGALAQAALYSVDPAKLAGWAATPYIWTYIDTVAYPGLTYLPAFGQIFGTSTTPSGYDETAVASYGAEVIIDIGQYKDFPGDTPGNHEGMVDIFDNLEMATGIPVVFIHAEEITDYDDMYDKLGQILGSATQTAPLKTYCEDLIDYVDDNVADAVAENRTIYYGEGSTGLQTNGTSGAGAIHQNLLGFIGAVNMANITSAAGSGKTPITFSQLQGWNPDAIILGPDASTLYNSLVSGTPPTSPNNWAALSAVSNGNVALVPKAFANWIDRPPSINRLLGVQWLMHIMFPDIYTYAGDYRDFREVVINFYDLFYHYDMSTGIADTILSTAEFEGGMWGGGGWNWWMTDCMRRGWGPMTEQGYINKINSLYPYWIINNLNSSWMVEWVHLIAQGTISPQPGSSGSGGVTFQSIIDSINSGIVEGGKSTWEGIKAFFTWDGLRNLALMLIPPIWCTDEILQQKFQIYQSIANSIKDGLNEFINGNANVKAYYVSRTGTELLLGLVGTKGSQYATKAIKIGKASDASKVMPGVESLPDGENEILYAESATARIAAQAIAEIEHGLRDIYYINKKIETADEVNAFWKSKGYINPPYKANTPVYQITLDRQTSFVKVYDGVNSSQQGQFIMKLEDIMDDGSYLTPEQIKSKYALKFLPKYVADVEIPEGAKINCGITGAIEGWGVGGGLQFDLNGAYIGNFTFRCNLNS